MSEIWAGFRSRCRCSSYMFFKIDVLKNFANFFTEQFQWLLLTYFQRSPDRSCRPEVFCKKDVLKNFAKFTGKNLCQSLFFNKVAGLRHLRTPPVAAYPEQKPVRLLTINKRLSWKKIFTVAKISTSVKEIVPEFFIFLF